MMGVNYGYIPGPKLPNRVARRKWAWLPVKSNSGKRIWGESYVILKTYQDKDGTVPIKGLYWKTIFTKNEYLIWQLKNPASGPQSADAGWRASWRSEILD
jgi:hypothetical protein